MGIASGLCWSLLLGEQVMRKKKKPHEERKSEDYMEAADNALELAKVLAGQGGISDQDFLERMARSDDVADHDGETCGMPEGVVACDYARFSELFLRAAAVVHQG